MLAAEGEDASDLDSPQSSRGVFGQCPGAPLRLTLMTSAIFRTVMSLCE